MSHYSYGEENPEELAYLDMKQFGPVVIADVTKDHMMDDETIIFCNIYKNSFYYDRRSIWQKWYQRAGTSLQYNFIEKQSVEKISVSINMTKAKPYLTYMDGKIYYGVSSQKEVALYCYDMATEKEETIFNYERKEKYIFYIDKKNMVHRIDKKTKKDRIISKRKSAGVDCTEDCLYIRVRDNVWYSDDFQDKWSDVNVISDYYSDHIYCMDFDGKNEERLWKGGYSEPE